MGKYFFIPAAIACLLLSGVSGQPANTTPDHREDHKAVDGFSGMKKEIEISPIAHLNIVNKHHE